MDIMTTQPVTRISADEYLRLERVADVKHAYVDGARIAGQPQTCVAFAGGSQYRGLLSHRAT
jgi:hypothetical protein